MGLEGPRGGKVERGSGRERNRGKVWRGKQGGGKIKDRKREGGRKGGRREKESHRPSCIIGEERVARAIAKIQIYGGF